MAFPAHRSILLDHQAHRSTLLDHQMIVDGVLIQERKGLTKTLNDETGVYQTLVTRVIGEKSYTTKQSITDGGKEEELIETDMDDSELENFNNEWEEKWNPSIWEDEPGMESHQIFQGF